MRNYKSALEGKSNPLSQQFQISDVFAFALLGEGSSILFVALLTSSPSFLSFYVVAFVLFSQNLRF